MLVLPPSYDEDVADRRNASEWLQPEAYVEELPRRPVPIRADDPEWKYVSVRRLAAYVERSIDHGLQWVVFEPNDERLWARVRQQVEEFLTALWRDGRLVGTKPEDAFFVKCRPHHDDRRTTSTTAGSSSSSASRPLRPAEFVIFRIGLWTAGSDDDDD